MGLEEAAESYYLDAEEQSAGRVEALAGALAGWEPLRKAMDGASDALLLFNEARQVVYTNAAFRQMLGPASAKELLGKRIGELFACARLEAAPSGCGTGLACRECHATHGLLTALRWGGSAFAGRLRVRMEGPREIPFTGRVETVLVHTERLLFCVVNGRHLRLLDPDTVRQAPAELQQLCQLLAAGGPYTPY